MGYSVDVTGRVLLPAHLEDEVLAVLRRDMVPLPGWLTEAEPVESLAELGTWVACGLRRDGDHLVLEPEEDGDTKWSEQATAFYLGLGRWVVAGRVDVHGENDARWSYVYGPDGAWQVGVNGWDGTGEDGPQPPGTDHTGTDRTGTDRTGTDRTGTQQARTDEASPHQAGADPDGTGPAADEDRRQEQGPRPTARSSWLRRLLGG